jgi:hypothetical protein
MRGIAHVINIITKNGYIQVIVEIVQEFKGLIKRVE